MQFYTTDTDLLHYFSVIIQFTNNSPPPLFVNIYPYCKKNLREREYVLNICIIPITIFIAVNSNVHYL